MTTLQEENAHFYNQAAAPRQTNRAKAHMVTMADLSQFYPDMSITDAQSWRQNFGTSAAEEIYPSSFRDNVRELLSARDLRRGDIIFLEFDIGYRNDGKLIFDGTSVTDLADEPDDYGTVPSEFQNFPPKYWSETVDHNVLVPLDGAAVEPANFRRIDRPNNDGYHVVCTAGDITLYFSQVIDPTNDLDEAEAMARAELARTTYARYRSGEDEELPWPADLSAENTLFVGPTIDDQYDQEPRVIQYPIIYRDRL